MQRKMKKIAKPLLVATIIGSQLVATLPVDVFATEGNITTKAAVTVSTWDALKAALTNTSVTEIELGADIKMGGNVLNVTGNKTIRGNGYTIDANKYEIKLTTASASGRMENVNIINTDHYGLFWSSAQNVVVTYKDVTHTGAQLIYLPNGELILEGNIKSTVQSTTKMSPEEVFQGKRLTVKSGATVDFTDHSSSIAAIRSATSGGVITIEKDASLKVVSNARAICTSSDAVLNNSGKLDLTSNNQQAIYMGDSNVTMNMLAGSQLKAFSGSTGHEAISATNGTINVESGAVFEVIGSGKEGVVQTGANLNLKAGSNFSIENKNATGPVFAAWKGSTKVSINSNIGINAWIRGTVVGTPHLRYDDTITASFDLKGYLNSQTMTNLVTNNSDLTGKFTSGNIGKIQGGTFANNTSVAPPVINASDRTITVGDTFDPMEGVSAFDFANNDITSSITVVYSAVDTSKPDMYGVIYQVVDSNGKKTSKTITVTVKAATSKPPVIDASDKTITVGANFNPLAEVTAADEKDGDLTDVIKVTKNEVNSALVGSYLVEYSVTNAAGLTTTKTITVSVIERTNTPPVIYADNKSIIVGSTFKPLDNVTAMDAEDGNITNKIIVVRNEVNTALVGTYFVEYSVTDSGGLTTRKTITVTVTQKIGKPVINASDRLIELGSDFNPLEGVTAKDASGNDITNRLEVLGTPVDTSKEGKYTVVYAVRDVEEVFESIIVTVSADIGEPVIKAEDKVITIGETFNPLEDVSVVGSKGQTIDAELTVTYNDVNTTSEGNYSVSYLAVNKLTGKQATKTITVFVTEKNEPPVFHLDEIITIAQGSSFNPLDDVTATDAEDGDITANIKVILNTVDTSKEGKYMVVLSVTDSKGMTTNVTQIVTVRTKPVISIPSTIINAYVGDEFDFLKDITAKDRDGKDITESLVVKGHTVDMSKPGVYTVVVEATDAYNISNSETYLVIVALPTAPVIEATDKTLELEDEFNPLEDVTATDKKDGDISADIEVIENTVDTSKPGEYKVVYSVTNSFDQTTTLEIEVTVIGEETATPEVYPVTDKQTSVSGLAEPNSTIIVKVGDTVIGEGTATETGAFEIAIDKEQAGGTEILVTAKAPKKVESAPKTVVVEIVDYALDVAKFDIERDTYLTGTTGVDIKEAQIFVNGTLVNKLDVENGPIKAYLRGKVTSIEDEVVVKGLNSSGEVVASINVELTFQDFKLTAQDYTVGQKNITGEVSEQATKVVLYVDGAVMRNSQLDKETNTYTVLANDYVTSKDQLVEVVASDGTMVLKRTKVNVEEVVVHTPPVMEAIDRTLNLEDEFNPLEGVTATDEEDGDITANIEVIENTVDTSKPGEYKVVYSVTNSFDQTTTLEIKVTVIGEETATPEVYPVTDKQTSVSGLAEPNSTIIVKVGDTVIGEGTATETGAFEIVIDKEQAGGTEILVTAKAPKKVESAPKTVIVEAVDYALDVAKFDIERDTYLTGTTGADIKEAQIFVNGTLVNKLDVENGPIKAYLRGKVDSMKDVVLVKGLNSNGEAVASVNVELTFQDFQLTAEDYTVGQKNITGEVGDQATKVVLYVDGVAKRNSQIDPETNTYTVLANDLVTSKDQLVEVVASEGTTVLKRTTVNVADKPADSYVLTVSDYTISNQFISGQYDEEATKVVLYVDGVAVRNSQLDLETKTYKVVASDVVTSEKQHVEVVMSKGTKELSRVTVGVTKVYNLTANKYMLGDTFVRGEYDKDATKVVIYIDGVAKKNSALNTDDLTYKVDVTNLISSSDQLVEVVMSKGTEELKRLTLDVSEQ
ncbi:immunoglobulin-like domain-containing protein [Listeria sp. SHR_NRA_18]|uniref:immunoglobulin-like domain-containing protein n=1 Tax=Listeria sp. SHR_NRA_18 TaxID=2269046 RepID=UPI00051DB524|nr:immunoglobulin-like domain-containing protein [Listeria sp. SHR_NRA_18]KGL39140.1 hypothetical protein EP56_14625 [Listeriaceae bacterium FSL A5-0209]